MLTFKTSFKEDRLSYMSVIFKQQQTFTPTVIDQYSYMISVINSNKFFPLIELFGIYALFILLLVKPQKTCCVFLYMLHYWGPILQVSDSVLNCPAFCLSIHLSNISN